MPTLTESAYAAADSAIASRPENLAVIFQEPLTAVERLRAAEDLKIDNVDRFRAQMQHYLRVSDQAARSRGYTDVDIQLAIFAVVAYLDETILNLHKPAFRDWVRKPLQEELFGRHVAGEAFFQNLDQLLGRRDSEETADVLEVYYLCLLLGYLGRYSIASRAELRSIMGQIEDKIRRIRKMSAELAPHWRPPPESGARRADPWIRRLLYGIAGTGGLTVVLFLIYRFVLSSGVTTLREMTTVAVQ